MILIITHLHIPNETKNIQDWKRDDQSILASRRPSLNYSPQLLHRGAEEKNEANQRQPILMHSLVHQSSRLLRGGIRSISFPVERSRRKGHRSSHRRLIEKEEIPRKMRLSENAPTCTRAVTAVAATAIIFQSCDSILQNGRVVCR